MDISYISFNTTYLSNVTWATPLNSAMLSAQKLQERINVGLRPKIVIFNNQPNCDKNVFVE